MDGWKSDLYDLKTITSQLHYKNMDHLMFFSNLLKTIVSYSIQTAAFRKDRPLGYSPFFRPMRIASRMIDLGFHQSQLRFLLGPRRLCG